MIPRGDNGEPATPEQIEGSFQATIGGAGIYECLVAGNRLVNHVIDYIDYVNTVRDLLPQQNQGRGFQLVIADSVLWSPGGRGRAIDLSPLGWGGEVGYAIHWTGVVMGPEVSGRNIVFHSDIDLRGATFHGWVDFTGANFGSGANFFRSEFGGVEGARFDGAIFNGIAGFYGGVTFRGPASFREVQFRKHAYFHSKTIFHTDASFAGATFGASSGSPDDSPEEVGEAYFHAGTTFHHKADFQGTTFAGKAYFHANTTFHGEAAFEGATFNSEQYFAADTFRSSVSFMNAVFGVEARFRRITFPGLAWFQGAQFNMGATFQDAAFGQEAIFDGAHFRQHVDFNGVKFAELARISFTRCIFGAVADFGAIKFPGPASFRATQFNMGATFREAVFNEAASIWGAVFNRQAIFEHARFSQRADFDGVEFAKEDLVSFPGSHFDPEAALEKARVSFMGSIFDADVSFMGARFPGPASFQGTEFKMRAFFHKSVFNRQAIFERARFSQRADFDGVEFAKEDLVSFEGSIFDTAAQFGGITFPGPASFQDARFNMGASFQDAEFHQQANFEGAAFGGYLSFRNAIIQKSLRLVDATWEGRVDLRDSIVAELDWDSDNRPTTVKGVFDARKAKLKRLAIKDVYFSDLADFSDVTFGEAASGTEGKILFEDLIFEKAADFLRSDFQADAIFVNNRFRKLLDFTNSKFPGDTRLCLSGNRIHELHMDREHLSTTSWWQLFRNRSAHRLAESRFRALEVTRPGEVALPYACAEPNQRADDHAESNQGSSGHELEKIYRSIESSFRDAKDRWGENEAWYLGTVANRKAGGWLSNGFQAIFLDLPSRHGIDFPRALAVSVLCVLLFWPAYWFYFHFVFPKKHQEWPVINLAASPEQRRAFRFRPFERLFRPTDQGNRSVHPWGDALLLSCRAFFKLGLGSSYPPVMQESVWKYVVYLEWFVGVVMLIHFLFVLKSVLPTALPFLGG